MIKKVADSAGGPVVGRSILQDIREFSAGMGVSQTKNITLICFGPHSEKIQPE